MTKITPVLTFLLLVFAFANSAQAITWPQELTKDESTVVIYQPQPEKLVGNLLTSRAAISLELKDREEPIFGAMWFTARIDTDTDTGEVHVYDMAIIRVAWPDSTDEGEQRFTDAVNKAVKDSQMTISMERLSASLESAEVERKSLENLGTEPPKIQFSEELALLLLYDGEPIFQEIENSNYERAVNTPLAVARHKSSKTVYLIAGTTYYQSADALGPFSQTNNLPQDLAQMLPEQEGAEEQRTLKIVTATEPTEVVSTDGAPDWKSLAGGQILYVQNTETPWLREINEGKMYLLLSGRWFAATGQAGPWAMVRPDQLPESFDSIPPDSDIGGLRVSVPGTEEAEQAMVDAAIPETTAIKRSEAKLDVEYDGDPKFESIDGTDVSFAVNTGTQVLEIDNHYYAVDNAVWFESDKPTGPWTVADNIPKEKIDEIPPTSPVYNTTYVEVFESTPEVVYVGYYPGYRYSYPYYGVPVYGTGWYYPPYYGGYYYPRPPTWGFHVGYNPWTGWSFGLSWSNGPFSIGIGWGSGWGCCGGYYGGGYRGPTFVNNGDINIGGNNNINIGNNVNIGNRDKVGDRMNRGDGNLGNRNNSIYDRPSNRARNADASAARQNVQRARPSTNRANDVFADRNGNVARSTRDGWQSRQNNSWSQGSYGSSRNNNRSTSNRASSLDYGGLNRSRSNRTRGTSREMRRPHGGGGMRRRR